MRFANALERIKLMQGATSENISEVKDKIIFDQSETGMKPVLNEDGTPTMRMDIREYIRRRLAEEGLTQYKLAKYLGKFPQGLNNFLTGRVPYPLEDIERILWVLDGKAWGEDEDNTRIIKQ